VNISVIGNGQSRQSIDLDSFKDWKIGCNAICRDYICDEIVAVDRRMVAEILALNYKNIIYTRPDWAENFKNPLVKSLPDVPFTGPLKADIPFHWNSGPYAILLAARRSPKQINLIGFDLWGDSGKVNNIYKNTTNYSSVDSKPVDPTHWVHQIKKLCEFYNSIEFIQHQVIDWQIPQEWLSVKNLTIKYFPV
jgi:hypothetical protein